ncbi:MAG: hypothetical protein IPM39_29470 [Chloroflexi bacterium]|nr:hypothetical protein [Chloroflexota bacterium]
MSKSIFDLDEFKPYARQFMARRSRAARYWRYYKAEAYNNPQNGSPMGQFVLSRIADATRPLFTPLARAVNLDVALIPGGWQLAATASQHQDAMDVLFRESAWPVEGDLFVKYVASMGEAALYISDERVSKRLRLQSLRPDAYLVVPAGRYDPTPALAILLTAGTDEKGDVTEEATILQPNLVRTYVNGEPKGVDGRSPQYTNALGFVPIVECKNDPGDGAGEPTFDDAIASLNQVNIQATHLANIIQKHVEPQWAAFGAEAGDLQKSGDLVWFFPEGSDVKAVLAAVDFDGVLKFIQEIKSEVKDSLPELSLSKLVGVERVAAATIELQMAEAVFKIRRMRKPVDLAVADALRLAGRVAADIGRPDLAALNDPTLAFDADRPVIGMDALTRLQIESASQTTAMSRLAFEREQMLIAGQQGKETPDA